MKMNWEAVDSVKKEEDGVLKIVPLTAVYSLVDAGQLMPQGFLCGFINGDVKYTIPVIIRANINFPFSESYK